MNNESELKTKFREELQQFVVSFMTKHLDPLDASEGVSEQHNVMDVLLFEGITVGSSLALIVDDLDIIEEIGKNFYEFTKEHRTHLQKIKDSFHEQKDRTIN